MKLKNTSNKELIDAAFACSTAMWYFSIPCMIIFRHIAFALMFIIFLVTSALLSCYTSN